ncbi:MAG: hypothetical protein J6T94_10925 [Bacteroidaceae bacterium]|nr:hypothetical protein [Bacteroidaceae bacterium]
MKNIMGNLSVCRTKIRSTTNIVLIDKSLLTLTIFYLYTVDIAVAHEHIVYSSVFTNNDVACEITTHDGTLTAARIEKQITRDRGIAIYIVGHSLVPRTDDSHSLGNLHIIGDGESTTWQIDYATVGNSSYSFLQSTIECCFPVRCHHRNALSTHASHRYNSDQHSQ